MGRFGQGLFDEEEEIPAHIRSRIHDDVPPPPKKESASPDPPQSEPPESKIDRSARKRGKSRGTASEGKRTSGSYKNHYVREDGVHMTKWGLHVPVAFVEKLKMFEGQIRMSGSLSEFVVRAVEEKMRREYAQRKQQGTWKSLDKMLEET